MTDLAIRVENLSKLYRIGKAQERYPTLRDAISDFRLWIGRGSRRARFCVQIINRKHLHRTQVQVSKIINPTTQFGL